MRKVLWERRRLLLVAIGLLLVCVWLFPVWHFNPFTGTYTYDPRWDRPGLLVTFDRPDERLLEVLNRQIARDGTYPPGASAKTTKVELTQVRMELYTDWYPTTTVTAVLHYADGSSRLMDFSFHGTGGAGLEVGSFAVAYFNTYARLGHCFEAAPTASYCDANPASP